MYIDAECGPARFGSDVGQQRKDVFQQANSLSPNSRRIPIGGDDGNTCSARSASDLASTLWASYLDYQGWRLIWSSISPWIRGRAGRCWSVE